MRKILMIALGLAAMAGLAQYSGYLSQTASQTGGTGGTNYSTATVYWPAGNLNLKLLNVDVTSDYASSVLTWRVATTPTIVAASALATATNFSVYGNGFTSNDVILVQNAAGSVTQATVFGNVKTTNTLINLAGTLRTNLAAGDIFKQRSVTLALKRHATTGDSTIYVDTTNGYTTSDTLIAVQSNSLWSTTISSTASNVGYRVPLQILAPSALSVGDAIYSKAASNTVATANSTNLNTVHVASAAGFSNADTVLLESYNGHRVIGTVDSTSNGLVVLTTVSGITMHTGDMITRLDNSTTAILSSLDRAPAIYLTSTNGYLTYVAWTATNATGNAAGVIVAAPSGIEPWCAQIAGTGTEIGVQTIGLGSTVPVDWYPPMALYTATNAYKLALAALSTDSSVLVTNNNASGVTNLALGNELVISPASGGTFPAAVLGIVTNQVLSRVNLRSAIILALAAGDQAYSTTSQTTPVGATTLRLAGPALLVAPPGHPAALSITGTNCAINGAIGIYQN